MLLIPCPWCGPRPDAEFVAGGEAHIARPADPAAASDVEWGDYLYFRENIKGRQRERWFHAYGCRRWFNIERDTVTHEITAAYRMGATVEGGTTRDSLATRIAGGEGGGEGGDGSHR